MVFRKPNFGPPPEGYIAGYGRGACGFITRGDIGPAKIGETTFNSGSLTMMAPPGLQAAQQPGLNPAVQQAQQQRQEPATRQTIFQMRISMNGLATVVRYSQGLRKMQKIKRQTMHLPK